jgi:regulatory protein
MTITAIKQQVKSPERVSLFVDGKYSFSLTLDQLLAEGLKVGLEIDEPRLVTLKRLSAEGKLRMRALEWLMTRPHSIREFRDYLRRKDADADLVDGWVEEFITRRYLDDNKFAEWFIEQRREHRHRSNRAIRAELAAKGIDRSLVAELMESSTDDEASALKALIEKKRRSPRYRDDAVLMAYLVRQGYGYSVVKDALAGEE